MIAPMKKVSVITVTDERDKTVNTLRELGVLHVFAGGRRKRAGGAVARAKCPHRTHALDHTLLNGGVLRSVAREGRCGG